MTPSAAPGGEAGGAFALQAAAPGRLAARGPLTFATARRAREQGIAAIAAAAGPLQIDCSAVRPGDSAGLAVLLDWLAAAKRSGCSLRYLNLPQDLMALARISDVEGLLERGI
jgi:phospholipid transport system transporter-binding protein